QCPPENEADDIGETAPALGLGLEMGAPLDSEFVELGLTTRFGLFPCSLEKLLVFEAVKCRVERSLLHLQSLAGHLLNSLCERIAVNGPKRNNPHDEEIEGALREVEFVFGVHTCFFYIYIAMCRRSRH